MPWVLRLSVGHPLVGAGFAGYFFSPEVQAFTRLFQVTVEFLLLFGLATRVVAAVALLAYLIRLPFDPALLLATEFVGGLLAIVVLGSSRPSADQALSEVANAEGTLFNRVDPVHGIAERIDAALEPFEDYAATVVRLALGFNFVYLGLTQKLLTPGRALQVVQKYDLTAVVPVEPGMWVVGVGLVEVALGLALLLGAFTRAVAGVAFLMFTVTLFGLASTLIVSGSGPFAVDVALHGHTEAVETTTGDPAPEEA